MSLRTRFLEQIRIYRDSPGVQLSYNDLARVYEDILEVMDAGAKTKKIGFKK